MSGNGQYVLLACDNNRILVSSDEGVTFQERGSTTLYYRENAYVNTTGQYMIISGGDGTQVSTDYGVTWSSLLGGSAAGVITTGVSMSYSGQYAIKAANTSTTYISSDYLTTATSFVSGISNSSAVAISGDGKYGFIFDKASSSSDNQRSSDFLATFVQYRDDPSNGDWRHAAMSYTGKYCIVRRGTGIIFMSTDFGVTWAQVYDDSAGGSNCRGAEVSYDGKYMAIGTAYSSDYGATWINISRGTQGITMSREIPQ